MQSILRRALAGAFATLPFAVTACSSSPSANESCSTYLSASDSDKQSAAAAVAKAHNDHSLTLLVRGSIRAYCELNSGSTIDGIYRG